MSRTPEIVLVYDRDCPNVEQCRAAIQAALIEAGLPQSWTEWDGGAPETPARYRALGSPTVLVNGRDVSAARADGAAAGASCRVYSDDGSGKLCGAPPVATITKALLDAMHSAGSALTSDPAPSEARS